MSSKLDTEKKVRQAAASASDAKADDVVVLDVRGISNITDFFLICTGSSLNHLRAIGKKIEEDLSREGIKPGNVDGYNATSWLVFDYGDVIIHAMTRDIRKVYDLERLWGDAPVMVF